MVHGVGSCPRCGENLNSDIGCVGVCSCGFTDNSQYQKRLQKMEMQTSIAYVVIGIVTSIVALHFFAWGSHAWSIPGLKVAEWTGSLSAAGYHELAQDCLDLGKVSCAEKAYFDMYAQGKSPEGLAFLASLQRKENKNDQAYSTLGSYIAAGGKDTDAMVSYAELEAQKGQIDQALKTYEDAAQLKPEILPVGAVSGAVRLLISQRRLEEAYRKILLFHASAENAKGYLNEEKGNLEHWLGDKVASAIEKDVNAQASSESAKVVHSAGHNG